MKPIDYRDSRPIYEQIAEYYMRLILSGALKTDEQLPSVRSLAIELSTNPNTVQKAYAELERKDYIYTVQGRGNFVKEKENLLNARREELIESLGAIFAEADEFGMDIDELVKKAKEGRRDK
ncbi:MAG: GntR family transcriptional regulator [Lachnospiraceae bacterium]|nr:GntR family transcriptional regulator [Lachnospiraceae bacterium]